MQRFEENRAKEDQMDRIFSYLRSKNQGDLIQIRDQDTDQVKDVFFLRRGRVNVRVSHPVSGVTELVELDRVVVG